MGTAEVVTLVTEISPPAWMGRNRLLGPPSDKGIGKRVSLYTFAPLLQQTQPKHSDQTNLQEKPCRG
jgi:hypothetical protein